jgi:hypothetical protein
VTVLSLRSPWIKVKERVGRLELSRKDPQTKWQGGMPLLKANDERNTSISVKNQDKTLAAYEL